MLQNIVLKDNSHSYNYMIETFASTASVSRKTYNRDGELSFVGTAIKNNDGWVEDYNIEDNELIPSDATTQTIRVWLPRFSIDTYRTKPYYILSAYTSLCGEIIRLGDFIINRGESLAGFKKVDSHEFFEYIDVTIPQVSALLYGDEWSAFRESINASLEDVNTEGTNIIVELTPCVLEDSIYNIYNYDTGVSVLEVDEEDTDMKLVLTTNINTANEAPQFKCTLQFNTAYGDDLLKYLKETYNIENPILLWEFYFGTSNDTYTYCKSDVQALSATFGVSELSWKTWDDYVEYCFAYAKCYIIHKTGIITETSNKLPITPEVFKFFIEPVGKWPNNIPLSNINMINYNLNFVNKVIKNIVSVERPNDYKANIIKPVFFKVKDSINISVHKDVSENICLPLNNYKSQVGQFYIKIEDATFSETGRVAEGVIFKIDCGKLTKSLDTGQYYILNSDMELVTSGKYTYV